MEQNRFFPEIRGRFGFGCMRLPTVKGGEVDLPRFCQMVDAFLAAGFNYFDTAHGYLSGRSEGALKAGLTSRYPREQYLLTDKLSNDYFQSEADIRPLFESQLAACGVDYFDFYLMHSQGAGNYGKFKACRAYETAFQLKAEGKIRHVGLSFHDKAEVLDRILTDYPQVELVQIQLNYADWDDPAVQSRLCYQVCQKHGKPCAVMEPLKGGSLVNLPKEAGAILKNLHGGSVASYGLRFAADLDNVAMVLSGMSTPDQMADNLSFMAHFKPLTEKERQAIGKVGDILRSKDMIPCTACRYCTDGCPRHISIPDLFACMNAKKLYRNWNADFYYLHVHTANGGKASDCIRCGKCEAICPQHLPIRDLLAEVADAFEKKR